jgi:glycosyl transferase family 9 (putative heptosyltransferase)
MSRVFVAPLSFGLGDLVVSLPAIQALITEGARSGDDTWLVARSPAQALLSERIDGLAGFIDEEDLDPARCDGRIVDLRDHPLQREHWWGSAEFEQEFGPLSINEILVRICNDMGIRADVSRPAPLLAHPRPAVRDDVLLVTETDGPSKRWPADRWAMLADAIRGAGASVRAVTRADPSPDLRATGIDAIPAPTPGEAVDLLGACRAVVGVDTGLTHLAVQQGTPTVTLFRHRSVYFRPWPHARAVRGDPCDAACIATEQRHAYNAKVRLPASAWLPWSCPVAGRCFDAVGPEQLLGALEEIW